MKVTVKIDERLFEVEIDDLHSKPVLATVEGQQFEVWPEHGPGSAPASYVKAQSTTGSPPPPVPAGPASNHTSIIHAPIPGVILTVAVKPGDTVKVGQEVCVLEAMKMKNSIRAPRAGEIDEVLVSNGQQVQHHDPLVKYVE